jgi:hypothetical protein
MFGETKRGSSIQDIIDRMTKRHKQFWSNIQYKDDEGRTINISRDFLEEGMTIDEVIEDYITHSTDEDFEQNIYTISRMGAS